MKIADIVGFREVRLHKIKELMLESTFLFMIHPVLNPSKREMCLGLIRHSNVASISV